MLLALLRRPFTKVGKYDGGGGGGEINTCTMYMCYIISVK